jgi:hypothetical protein
MSLLPLIALAVSLRSTLEIDPPRLCLVGPSKIGVGVSLGWLSANGVKASAMSSDRESKD